MTNGARDRDRQLAAGINVAKKSFGYAGAAFLPEIPALEYHRHLFHWIPESERPSVEDDRDDRLAEPGKRVDQFVLLPDEIQVRAVAEMVQHPGFARSLLVAADSQNDYVRAFCDLDRFDDALAIFDGITGQHFVLYPGTATRDLATFVIQDFEFSSHSITNAG